MLILEIIALVLWLLGGILVLANKEVTKFEYAIVWITLILELIVNLFN